MSDEVYILSKYNWFLLKNNDNIRYHEDHRMDLHFQYYMSTYNYEHLFFDFHSDLKIFCNLKELYIKFNKRNVGNPSLDAAELDELIKTYVLSNYDIFKELALLLYKHREHVINSFIMV